MVDPVSILVTAGVTIAEKIVTSWFERGTSKVRMSQLEEAITALSAREADRLRVRQDDLERITDHIVRQLINHSPELSYAKATMHGSSLTVDYDPADRNSANALLRDLQARLNVIATKEMARFATGAPVRGRAEQPPPPRYEVVPPPGGPSTGPTRSTELLGDLQRRVTQREEPRR